MKEHKSLARILKLVKYQILGTWYFDFTTKHLLGKKLFLHNWRLIEVSIGLVWFLLSLVAYVQCREEYFKLSSQQGRCVVISAVGYAEFGGSLKEESPIVCLLKNNLKVDFLLPIFLYK